MAEQEIASLWQLVEVREAVAAGPRGVEQLGVVREVECAAHRHSTSTEAAAAAASARSSASIDVSAVAIT